MLSDSKIHDKKGRELSLKRCIFVIVDKAEKICEVGFLKKDYTEKNSYDLVLNNKLKNEKNEKYFSIHGYKIKCDTETYQKHLLEFLSLIFVK